MEAAGGRILYNNGSRVMGILAMTRALGDHALRPYVVAEPEVSCTQRERGDSFLLLASDGVWDVLRNQVCVCVVGGGRVSLGQKPCVGD